MWMAELIAAAQANGSNSQAGSSTVAGYIMIALVAIVLGLIAWVIIGSSFRRSSRH